MQSGFESGRHVTVIAGSIEMIINDEEMTLGLCREFCGLGVAV